MLKRPYHRDPKLRYLARGQFCQVGAIVGIELILGGAYFHDPLTVVWCHSNMANHGKGGHLKAHDCFGFLGCAKCHYAIDQGPRLNRVERRLLQHKAMALTRRYLVHHALIDGATHDDLGDDDAWLEGWRSGRIRVAAGH